MSTADVPVLTVDNVNVRFGGVHAVRDATLHAYAGEVTSRPKSEPTPRKRTAIRASRTAVLTLFLNILRLTLRTVNVRAAPGVPARHEITGVKPTET